MAVLSAHSLVVRVHTASTVLVKCHRFAHICLTFDLGSTTVVGFANSKFCNKWVAPAVVCFAGDLCCVLSEPLLWGRVHSQLGSALPVTTACS